MVQFVVVALCLLLGTSVLSACEYSAGENSTDPKSTEQENPDGDSPRPGSSPNLAALTGMLGPQSSTGLPYSTGTSAAWTMDVPAGEYLLTAACVGSRGAEVTVQQGDSAPEKSSFQCGRGHVVYLDHKGGRIVAEVVPDAKGQDGVTGIRLDRHPVPRVPSAAETAAWAVRALGPEQAGEIRGYPVPGQWLHSGPVAMPGPHTFTFVCEGPATVDLKVSGPEGVDITASTGLPCGAPIPLKLQVGHKGVMVMLESNNAPVQAAYSLLPAAGNGP